MKYTVEKISEDFKCPYLKIDKNHEEIMRIPVSMFDELKPIMGGNAETLTEIVHIIFNELNKYE